MEHIRAPLYGRHSERGFDFETPGCCHILGISCCTFLKIFSLLDVFCMEKKMGEAVARVARKVNETVENKTDSLDLADCKLMTFPIALYKVMRHVTEGIHLITLANNELKAVTSKFITTFSQLRELNLEGNYIHRLPEEVRTLSHLRLINLSRNKFQQFPEQLTSLQALETINLEENEIAGKHSLKMPATDASETSGRNSSRTWPHSPKNPQKTMDAGQESLQLHIRHQNRLL
ncbi:leucine-rich repeat-containing protein 20 isoform X2 [Sceloporus undulatus]|uniref:leucine-rich repeat-containing protein 20 isoform X2 n=1 Tax=Sceloporus undulatus TaxID=8520 RepID=UPI001C4C2D97|nr:leucine-rich repeat-containing protein 20 isoform X2 [Sceloporus undulatus]